MPLTEQEFYYGLTSIASVLIITMGVFSWIIVTEIREKFKK